MVKKPYLTLLLNVLLVAPLRAQSFSDFLVRVNTTSGAAKIALIDSFMSAVPSFPFVENDTTVHFIYRGGGSKVAMAGDANGWNPTASPLSNVPGTDFWYRTEHYEPDARLDYKYVLNSNQWILDPRNPLTIAGGFGPNSELRMPAYVPAPEIEYDPTIPHGTLQDTTFSGAGNIAGRQVRVYLPPGYDTTSIRYPLILFHDGLDYLNLGKADHVLDYLITHGKIRPIIAVFVPAVRRSEEYAGSLLREYTDFLLNSVLAWADSRFRTLTDPAFRAVAGASNGGNISLYMAVNHPEVFGLVAAQSSNVEPGVHQAFAAGPKRNLKLYLDLGTYDIPILIPRVRNFIPVLEQWNYDFIYQEFHEGHSWGNWRAHLDNFLEFFFPLQPTAVQEAVPSIPELVRSFPNPFRQAARFTFRLEKPAHVSISVFDLLGRRVATVASDQFSAGDHQFMWNGTGDSGTVMPSGVYLYRVRVNGRVVQTGRTLLLRR